MTTYKLGDKVEILSTYPVLNAIKHGDKATVVSMQYAPNEIGLEFTHEISGHDCNGLGKNKYCQFINVEHIRMHIEAVAKKVIAYKAGQKITKYISEVLKEEGKHSTRAKWLMTYQRCILPENVRDLIEEAITVVLRKDVFDKWGLNTQFEKGITNSILLYGPSGTGKTMISESIAAVLDKNMMKLDSGAIQSNIPGQTERNIKENFKKAADNNCVLLLDECDSLLYNRDAVGAIMSSEINTLLQEIENFDGVVILTTNRVKKLDPALSRRIIAKVQLPLPNQEARKQIWEKLIPAEMPVGKLDFKELSEADLSGGEIKNAILLAARKAIAKNKDEVTMAEFRSALIGIEESSGKVGQEDYIQVR